MWPAASYLPSLWPGSRSGKRDHHSASLPKWSPSHVSQTQASAALAPAPRRSPCVWTPLSKPPGLFLGPVSGDGGAGSPGTCSARASSLSCSQCLWPLLSTSPQMLSATPRPAPCPPLPRGWGLGVGPQPLAPLRTPHPHPGLPAPRRPALTPRGSQRSRPESALPGRTNYRPVLPRGERVKRCVHRPLPSCTHDLSPRAGRSR